MLMVCLSPSSLIVPNESLCLSVALCPVSCVSTFMWLRFLDIGPAELGLSPSHTPSNPDPLRSRLIPDYTSVMSPGFDCLTSCEPVTHRPDARRPPRCAPSGSGLHTPPLDTLAHVYCDVHSRGRKRTRTLSTHGLAVLPTRAKGERESSCSSVASPRLCRSAAPRHRGAAHGQAVPAMRPRARTGCARGSRPPRRSPGHSLCPVVDHHSVQ